MRADANAKTSTHVARCEMLTIELNIVEPLGNAANVDTHAAPDLFDMKAEVGSVGANGGVGFLAVQDGLHMLVGLTNARELIEV